MTTPQPDPVRRNEAERTPVDRQPNDRRPDGSNDEALESIDESMAEADRANGEGDPDDASQIHHKGERNGQDTPKPMRRAE